MRKAHLVLALTLLILIASGESPAQRSPDLAGQWILALGNRALLVLSITTSTNPAQPFSGSLARPRHFQESAAGSFSHIYGGVKILPIVSSTWKGAALSLTVRNPDDASDQDTFLVTLKDDTHALLQNEGIPLPPSNLVRAQAVSTVATDWDKDKVYSPDDGLASNLKMKQIFDEDQRVRQPGAKIDWAVVGKSDGERRQAVMKLLNEDALHTGEDFTWAAFIFQHGLAPEDFLLAHTLALVALKKGRDDALWIASATLDRYLQNIHQPQIYGTQFLTKPNQPTTQEPYNRALVSDALRRQLGVPAEAAQEEQRKQYNAQRGTAK